MWRIIDGDGVGNCRILDYVTVKSGKFHNFFSVLANSRLQFLHLFFKSVLLLKYLSAFHCVRAALSMIGTPAAYLLWAILSCFVSTQYSTLPAVPATSIIDSNTTVFAVFSLSSGTPMAL